LRKADPSFIAPQARIESGRRVEAAAPVRTPCTGLLEDGTGVSFERLASRPLNIKAVHRFY
jgi:hypothetical protein